MAIKVRDISGPSTLVYNILFVSHDAITKYDIRLFTLTPEGFTLTVALNRILFSAPIKMLKESSRQNTVLFRAQVHATAPRPLPR